MLLPAASVLYGCCRAGGECLDAVSNAMVRVFLLMYCSSKMARSVSVSLVMIIMACCSARLNSAAGRKRLDIT